jgi:hypothetical protein
MLKGMNRYLVAVAMLMCVSSVSLAAPGHDHNRSSRAVSPSAHLQVTRNATVKRSVSKTWIAGKFVRHGRTLRWVSGHYDYKTIYPSCTGGHWTRQYGRDIWVAGRCSVI